MSHLRAAWAQFLLFLAFSAHMAACNGARGGDFLHGLLLGMAICLYAAAGILLIAAQRSRA